MAADFVVPELAAEPIVAALAGDAVPAIPSPKAADEKKPEDKKDEDEDMEESKKAANYEQLKAACYGADAAFICAQLEAKATVAQAQTAWMVAQQSKIDAANQAAANAKASANKPGVPAIVSSGKEKPLAIEGNPAEAFNAEVAKLVASGMSKPRALSRVTATNQELHAAYIAAYNEMNGRKAAARKFIDDRAA